jgi:hypothetical protein
MTREFCTLFDSNYVFKAVAMHRSLLATGADFHLTAFCFDDEAKRLIDRLGLPHLSAVALPDLEAFDPEFAGTKADRTPVEYCWTATPAVPLYVLGTRPEVNEITYLDADLLFFRSPEPLFEEMAEASVMITPHRYAPEFAHQQINGIYNVQFMVFRRDQRGMRALQWWHDRCVEWCYYRLEDGKLGDQKYLDDWPERFDGVHVLQHKGGGLAPWNVTQYDVRPEDRDVLVDDDPLVFFHYHRVALAADGNHRWQPPGYRIDANVERLVYGPYLAACDRAIAEVQSVAPGFSAGLEPKPTVGEHMQRVRAAVGARVAQRAPGLARLITRLRTGG